MNLLEQLVSEWYEYRGYYVLRNVRVGLLQKGGYAGELDVVAFNPEDKKVVHIEPSNDALSWAKREVKYKMKFEMGKKHIPSLLKGFKISNKNSFQQIALFGAGGRGGRETIAGGKILLIQDLLTEIFSVLKNKKMQSRAVPEKFPLLRTLQYVATHKKPIFEALNNP